jgi:glycosyltransferase involved in cell wall biosynthesis
MVVLYAGNMGHTHDLESVVMAAAILKGHSGIQFIFIGNGGKRNKIENISRQHDLKNVLFLPFQDSVNFPLAMSAADIGIVTLGAGAEGLSVPSKTYVNMAAGVCLLAIGAGTSELSSLVKHYDMGVVVEPDHPGQVADQILYLYEHQHELERMKRNARQASFDFTQENAKRYVEEVFSRQ